MMSGSNVNYDRIAHLENNAYIYGEPIPFPSANHSAIATNDSFVKTIENDYSTEHQEGQDFDYCQSEKDEALTREGLELESIRYKNLNENSYIYKDIQSSIERQIQEKEVYWARKSAEIRDT